jgi:hypothetical protein
VDIYGVVHQKGSNQPPNYIQGFSPSLKQARSQASEVGGKTAIMRFKPNVNSVSDMVKQSLGIVGKKHKK